MTTDSTATGLRYRVRRKLLGHLEALGHDDPTQRAAAALAASQIMQEQGMSWRSLLPPAASATTEAKPPPDWRTQALLLAHHPAVSAPEHGFLMKLVGWRAPGADGMARMREVAGRLGVELHR